jgi:tRNA threonylcarbamoyladenosine biosynthesis protein TsaB
VAYILHIESTSTVCSIALSDKDTLIAVKELNNGYTHAENLHLFIQDVLKEAGITAHQLNAISVSKGPGSYTGLRIGFSAAKGLAYSLQIPLITIDTLQALTVMALKKTSADALYCPMLDARRMEVYCAMYTQHLEELLPVNAMVLDEESIKPFAKKEAVYFFGDGMPKAKTLLSSLPNAHFIEDITASAIALINLAWQKHQRKEFADTAYAEPNYLKEFFFTSAKK